MSTQKNYFGWEVVKLPTANAWGPNNRYDIGNPNSKEILSHGHSTKYHILTNETFSYFIDQVIIASKGKLQFDKVGSLNGGRRVMATLKNVSKNQLNLLNVPIKRYLVLFNDHGGGSFKVGTASHNCTCNNQEANLFKEYSLTHTYDIFGKMARFAEVLDKYFKQDQYQQEFLIQAKQVKIDPLLKRQYMKQVFDIPVHDSELDKSHSNLIAKIDQATFGQKKIFHTHYHDSSLINTAFGLHETTTFFNTHIHNGGKK